MSPRTARALLPLMLAAALGLSACATLSPSPADGGPSPAGPIDVVGQGTVIQVGDAAPEFCLGGVAESYPPQCSGPELSGWDWAAYEGSETASNVTWGTYAVFGNWDGNVLSVDSAIMLALYDTVAEVDPLLDEANAGSSSEQQLLTIQDGIFDAAPVEVLSSWPDNGYLFVWVVYDDGSVQAWADTTYGPDVVAVRSALKPLDG
ncbi:hypothetical protein QMG83_09320 [Salinibacterium sp. G-O1]|uniref:hypothetical protein n=1 Tax=Salinibacterium sp. G-O1 TaxID=3046208 RepID=UPI0024B9D0EE|nr:hypothetical protein [Salinibacterium sp. G-O1]MDJ0335421.1 hypothetical protein [Salinibacterium sp. G-O1]